MKPDHSPDMLDCGRAMAQLFDLLDGESTADTAQKLREHISLCPECFTHADFERRFLAAVQAARRKDGCPGALRAKVLEALQAEGFGGAS